MGVVASILQRDEENPKALTLEVDRRLYLAKERGRNTIVADAEASQAHEKRENWQLRGVRNGSLKT